MQQLSDKNRNYCPFRTVKKDSKGIAVLLREGISFLWGIAKNYIMYWGVTSSIIAEHPYLVNAKLAQTLQFLKIVFVNFDQTKLQILLL